MRRVYYMFGLLALFGVVFAAAATLNVHGGVIQAGEDLNLKCDSAVRVAGWGYEHDDDLVYSVRIVDINATCRDSDETQNELFVNITCQDNLNNVCASGEKKLPLDQSTGDKDTDVGEVGVSVSFDSPLNPKDITDIHIVLESDGPNAQP